MGVIVCSVKDAFELMKHMDDDDMVILSIVDKKNMSMKFPKNKEKEQ